MLFKYTTMAALSVGVLTATAGVASARDQVQIAGSSTVLPYANIVAEEFGKSYAKFKKPVVESGGSSAGLKQFCKGLGPNTIDIANSSRQIRSKEVDACGQAGVKKDDILEVVFGYDGIVFASDIKGPSFAFEPKDIYMALAKTVPVDGKMVDNPHKTWKDINPNFPAWKIVAFIPGEKHGTREVFEVKVLEAGCKTIGALDLMQQAGMDKKVASKACFAVRKDGGTVDIDGDYTETLARLNANKESIGVFGLSFYENNIDKLKVATVSGIKPSVETIATGKYPVSRPLQFYVKLPHVKAIPGLREYVSFFGSKKMIGPDGPLAAYGLVPMPAAEFTALQTKLKDALK
jgi:phosphate transport system substrate-binding protein